jgi:hypothetical protein
MPIVLAAVSLTAVGRPRHLNVTFVLVAVSGLVQGLTGPTATHGLGSMRLRTLRDVQVEGVLVDVLDAAFLTLVIGVAVPAVGQTTVRLVRRIGRCGELARRLGE